MIQHRIDLGFIEERPKLYGLEFYLWCFIELGTTRKNGGPISFFSIHKFAKIYEIQDFEEFLDLIRLMDDTFLKAKEKDASKHSNKSNSSSSPGKRG